MKKKRIILLLILALVLVTICILLLLKNNIKNKSKDNVYLPVAADTSDDLRFSGTGVFFDKFNGDFTASEVSSALERIVTNYLPKVYNLTKDYDTSNLEIFFNNNSKNLANMLGITNKEDFVKLAQEMQKVKADFSKSKSIEVLKDTFIDESDKEGYAYTEFVVTLDNNLEEKFCVYVAKSASEEISYIVNVVD